MSQIPNMASDAGHPSVVGERPLLEIMAEAYNNSEETKRQLLEREKIVWERENRLLEIDQALKSEKDAVEKRSRYLDGRERAIGARRETPLSPLPQVPPVSPIHLPPKNQPNRPLDFALIQAQLLQNTIGGQPLRIGGYASNPCRGDSFASQGPFHDFQRHFFARGLHHGGEVGVWVSTVADHQVNAVSRTTKNSPDEPSPFQDHSSGTRKRAHSQGKQEVTVAGVPVKSLPTGPLAYAIPSQPSPTTTSQKTPRRSVSAGSGPATPFAPRISSPLSQVSSAAPSPSTRSGSGAPTRDGTLDWPSAARVSRRKGEWRPGESSHCLRGRTVIPQGSAARRRASSTPNPIEPQGPARYYLPASLIQELPAFRRAALTYSSSQAAAPLLFPPVRMQNPASPGPGPGALSVTTSSGSSSLYSASPVENHPHPTWRRNLDALLADQPYQAHGVFVNGLVLRGRDLPWLVAAMTPREAEILFVVHPWMGEPVAYM